MKPVFQDTKDALDYIARHSMMKVEQFFFIARPEIARSMVVMSVRIKKCT